MRLCPVVLPAPGRLFVAAAVPAVGGGADPAGLGGGEGAEGARGSPEGGGGGGGHGRKQE